MATLDELVFYCKMKEPAGALALVGESGSGKSHLVDTDLTEALRDSATSPKAWWRAAA